MRFANDARVKKEARPPEALTSNELRTAQNYLVERCTYPYCYRLKVKPRGQRRGSPPECRLPGCRVPGMVFRDTGVDFFGLK